MPSSFRVKCPGCGKVADLPMGAPCPSCHAPMPPLPNSFIQIYRMGSPIGMAVGYGLYINGEPYGHIGNRQSICVPLPYGSYNLHFTCGMTRRCQDLVVLLTPETPAGFVKAHIRMGFWTNKIIAEPALPEDMPPMD